MEVWLRKFPYEPLLVITEGEKKAACAVKHGIPAIGISGVDSWRGKTLVIPSEAELTKDKTSIRAKLPSGSTHVPELSLLADGWGELLDKLLGNNLTVVIVYDTDQPHEGQELKTEVRRAATMLGYELRYLGIPSVRIKLLVLPHIGLMEREGSTFNQGETIQATRDDDGNLKTGVDDYILARGPDELIDRLRKTHGDPTAFPKHPNPRGFINVQLNKQLDRKACQQLSSVILAELDASGTRYLDRYSNRPYYYERDSHKLYLAQMLGRRGELMHETGFGTLLYRRFGLTGSDIKVISWIASQFTGELPLQWTVPRRVMTLITEEDDPENPHGFALQVSDSHYLAVSPDPKKALTLKINGADGILFEQDQVEPLDIDRVMEYFEQEVNAPGPLQAWWADVLRETNLGKNVGIDPMNPDREIALLTPDGARSRAYACLLYYISPFLQRWRGLQLPVEITLGEAGSGKSSLYAMRLQILTGRPILRNLPNDLRDWRASITNSGGLHVTDNVHFADGKLKQQLSDEICRLITEPHPAVEMRKLYTDNDLVRIPVGVTFGFTAINQPFRNADFFSRAAVFNMASLGRAPDGSWVDRQIDQGGGREAWVAHHLVFLHRFMRAAEAEGTKSAWDPNFQTTHRLAHLEQTLKIASDILGIDSLFLGTTMRKAQEKSREEADWVVEGLMRYAKEIRDNPRQKGSFKFTARDVSEWAQSEDDFMHCTQLTSSRQLGRYLTSHHSSLCNMLNMVSGGLQGNIWTYRLLASKPEPEVEVAIKTEEPEK
jgi:hypothetical protein